MRLLVYVIVALLASVSLALIAREDPGYVLINLRGWLVESTVVTATVVVLGVYVLLYFALRFLSSVWQMPADMRRWRLYRLEDKSGQTLLDGLTAYARGEWQAAEKAALRFSHIGKAPLLNYLTAARAAHELGQYQRRDQHLEAARQCAPGEQTAIGLTQAELLIKGKQLDKARHILQEIYRENPRNREALRLLVQCYVYQEDWEHFLELTPALRKFNVILEKDIEALETRAYAALLDTAADNATAVQRLWQRTPKDIQENQAVLSQYIQHLIDLKSSDIAESMIRNALRRQWNDGLVQLYGLIDGVDVKSQLQYAEAWLKERRDNPVLLLTLGRLCMRNKLWGKARDYLEAAIARGASEQAYNELGHLLEALNEPQAALQAYRAGLQHLPRCRCKMPTSVGKLEAPVETPALLTKPSVSG